MASRSSADKLKPLPPDPDRHHQHSAIPPRAISFGPICLAGTCSGWDEQCLQNSTSRTIPRSSFWVPVGETPTMHAFTASGASTFDFLPDAVIHAQKEAAHRPEQPWISTSDVLFGPDQIRVLYATITAEEAS